MKYAGSTQREKYIFCVQEYTTLRCNARLRRRFQKVTKPKTLPYEVKVSLLAYCLTYGSLVPGRSKQKKARLDFEQEIMCLLVRRQFETLLNHGGWLTSGAMVRRRWSTEDKVWYYVARLSSKQVSWFGHVHAWTYKGNRMGSFLPNNVYMPLFLKSTQGFFSFLGAWIIWDGSVTMSRNRVVCVLILFSSFEVEQRERFCIDLNLDPKKRKLRLTWKVTLYLQNEKQKTP